jgi:predicted permease
MSADDELDREIRDHLELEAEERRQDGLSDEEARFAARRAFGNVTRVKETVHESSPWAWLERLWQDAHQALRMLAKSPGFTTVAILTLALGIGANTAIFSVVEEVLLRPLPFADPGRLVHIAIVSKATGQRDWVGYRDVEDWRERSRSFESVGAYGFALLNLVGTNQPEALYGSAVTSSVFPTLGVAPALGRNFTPEEDTPDGSQVVILSDQLWTTRFGRDPGILGKRIRLVGFSREDFTVVGVMPPDFNFPLTIPSAVNPPSRQMAFWIPVGLDPAKQSRRSTGLMAVARLKPGVSLRQAQAEMDAVAAGLAREYPDTNTGRGVRLSRLGDHILGDAGSAMLILLCTAGAVILIACANIANLLLVRAATRARETAVRIALGAGRWRLVRQWLTESVVLSLLGGAAGVVVAWIALRVLLRLVPEDIPRVTGTRLDPGALLFTLGVSLVAGLLFGVLPAWKAAGGDLQESLKGGGRTTGGPVRSRARSLLIVGEVSLAVVLAASAGLLIRSFARLLQVDSGFSKDRILTAIIVLPSARYPDQPSRVVFFHKLLDRVKELPGFEAAGVVNGVPLSGNLGGGDVDIEGRRSVERGDDHPYAEIVTMSPDYPRAMGIPLLQGRELSQHDAESGFQAVLVNRAAAEQFWPRQSPLGKRLNIDGSHPVWRQVVGVVGNTRDFALDQPVIPTVYVLMEQGNTPPQFFAARTRGPATGMAASLRAAVTSVDKDQPVFVVTSMRELLDHSVARRRFTMTMLAVFSLLSLVLAAVGIYGVISYSVAHRSHELALRAALGARPGGLVLLVLKQGMGLTLAGLAAGLAGTLLVSRLLSSLLYEIRPHDPFTLALVCAVLGAVATLASYLPARRATRVDPIEALRQE